MALAFQSINKLNFLVKAVLGFHGIFDNFVNMFKVQIQAFRLLDCFTSLPSTLYII
jgi:hypothetical protein